MTPLRSLAFILLLAIVAPPARAGDLFTPVPTPCAAGSGEPYLYTTPGGITFLSWVEPGDGHRYALRFARLEGNGWSEPVTIAAGDDWFVNWADVPPLVADDNGWMAAAFLQKTSPDTYAYGVRLTQSTDGGATWSAPVTPHVTATPADGERAEFAREYRGDADVEHGFVSMLPAHDGVRLVWLDAWKFRVGKEETTVLSGYVPLDGSATRPVEIDTRACDCCPTAAVAVSSGITVAYRDRSHGEVRDIRVARLQGGAWEKTWSSEDDWKIAGCPVNGPAMDARGDTVSLAWFTMAKETPAVNVVHSTDGGTNFGAPVRIDGGSPLGRVDLVSVPGGTFVSWLETVGDDAELRVRHVPYAGVPGPPVVITAASAKRSSGYGRITRSGGVLIAAWTDVSSEKPVVRTALALPAAVMRGSNK